MAYYSRLRLNFKIGFGVFVFSVSLLAIFIAFVLSVGILFDIIINSAFYLALLLGPLLFVGLFLILIMLFSEGNRKRITLGLGIIIIMFGVFDVVVRSLSSSQKIPLIKLVSQEKSNAEILSEYSAPSDMSVYYEDEENYFRVSDTLGYMPSKNRSTHSYETWNDQKIFDVQYTIDESGLRVSPPFNETQGAKSLLFFGGSVTFGYGLPDQQTMPYQVGLKTDGHYKVFNFAFNGYGTHHMVAALENNFVDSRVDISPEHIFYIATPLHIDWIKNRKNWGRHDPMYILDENKQVHYEGRFDELPSEIVKNLLFDCQAKYENLKLRSYTIQLLDPVDDPFKKYTQEDKDLFVGLIKKASELAIEKYPEAKFHVIYWNGSVQDEEDIIQLFEDNNFDYYLVNNIIPNYHENFRAYWINYPADAHPNYRANEIISDFIIKNIINKNEDYL